MTTGNTVKGVVHPVYSISGHHLNSESKVFLLRFPKKLNTSATIKTIWHIKTATAANLSPFTDSTNKNGALIAIKNKI